MRIAVIAIIFSGLLLTQVVALAQEPSEAEKARLQAELARVEKEIAAQTKLLQAKQQQSASIQRDIDILTVKIKRARLNIEAKTLEIKRLGGDINKKEVKIVELTERNEREVSSLAELLRQTREMDEVSIAEVVLANATVSDFFSDLESFQSVQYSLQNSVQIIKETKVQTHQEKTSLEKRRNAELDARKVIEAEKVNIERDEKEKQRLLSLSKSEENSYKKVIADREREKQAILNALFRLRDTRNISFGQALEYAKVVSKGTSVRPAFLLAIITQESNLGQNVGTCNRPGDPVSKQWMNIMKPSRDIEPYLAITKELGITPETQPLSCPQGGGWGGAMGPAQFIPSTWQLYKAKVAQVTGNNPANPWNPQDAFAASGIYLSELGARAQTYSAEHQAAARYYAGSNWATAGQGYANSVMRIAADYQAQINILAQ